MKIIVCAVLLVAVVVAEPPSYRQVKFRSAREEPAHAESSGPESAPYPAAGIKPTKEFNLPVRQELTPPAASYGTPEDSYGVPFNTFLAPQAEYGPPKAKISERRKDEKKEEHSESESHESPESGESKESSEQKGSVEKKEKSEKDEKKEKPEKPEMPEKSDKPEKPEMPEKSDKPEKPEKPEKSEKKQKENLQDASDGDEIISTKGAYFLLLPSSQLQRVQYSTQNDLTKMAYTANLHYMNEKAPVYIYSPTPQYQPIQQPVVAAYSYAW